MGGPQMGGQVAAAGEVAVTVVAAPTFSVTHVRRLHCKLPGQLARGHQPQGAEKMLGVNPYDPLDCARYGCPNRGRCATAAEEAAAQAAAQAVLEAQEEPRAKARGKGRRSRKAKKQ